MSNSTLAAKLTAAAELLKAHGVGFLVKTADGHHSLDGQRVIAARDIAAVVTDPDGWLARQYGVSVERLRAWKSWQEDHGQCTATTRKGLRCRNFVGGCIQDVLPDKFVPGESDCCDKHVDVSK